MSQAKDIMLAALRGAFKVVPSSKRRNRSRNSAGTTGTPGAFGRWTRWERYCRDNEYNYR